jgi:hypothetical protein
MDDILRDYRSRLLERDASLAKDYVRRWMRVEDAMEAQYLNLALDVADLRAAGQPVTESQIYQIQRYQSLLAQARTETERFNQFAAGSIEREQWQAGKMGIDLGADTILARFGENGIQAKGSFSILPIEALRGMIGMAADGSPLVDLLRTDYPKTVAALTQALINGIALGYNPRKTAKMMATAMAGNLQRALLVSRTETTRALRVGQVQQFRESKVVSGYRRRASLTAQTCLACLMEDGRFYSVITQFSDHPAGRCVAEPVLTHYTFEGHDTGRDWFLKQNADKQKEIMGKEYYQAWKGGAFGLDQVSRIHQHPVWGESPQVVPLKELTNAI